MIIIDDREPEEIEGLLSDRVEVKKTRLLLGDVIIGNIAIERKEREDLENSIIDGRLFRQLDSLLNSFDRVVLIIEGTKRFERINRNALIAAISSYLVRGVSVFFTRNIEETAEVIYWISKKVENNNKEKPLIGRKPKRKEEVVLSIIETLPGISVKTAKNIAKEFETLEELFKAREEHLRKVEGIGKEKARRIAEIFRTPLKECIEED